MLVCVLLVDPSWGDERRAPPDRADYRSVLFPTRAMPIAGWILQKATGSESGTKASGRLGQSCVESLILAEIYSAKSSHGFQPGTGS